MRKTKSRAAAGLFLVVLMCLMASDKAKLIKIKVNNELSVMIPKDWAPMDDMDFTERYPSVRKPIAAYTNQDHTVDFSINTSATQWPDGDLTLPQKFFKASLYNMFDKIEFLGEGVKEVKKRKFIYFEFVSRVHGNRKELTQKDAIVTYSYIQYLVEPGRTLVFSFHCPTMLREEWQETAHDMMDNIIVKTTAAGQAKK